MRLEPMTYIQPERGDIQVDPARLGVECVEVAKDDENVRTIIGSLAVTDHRGIIGLVESKIGIAMQGGTLSADPVAARNQVLQALRTTHVPLFQLVLLRIQILFAPLLQWRVFAKLEGGTVDSIVCTESGGKNEADHESRTASHLQELGKYVGRIGP